MYLKFLPAFSRGWAKIPPFRYNYWEKSEEEIYSGLSSRFENMDTEKLILSIHQPPYGSALDIVPDERHFTGSKAIKKLLINFNFHIVLTGHNHESFKMARGAIYDEIGNNIVINPGAYHSEQICAVVFDASEKNKWERLL
ncbi:MAG: metallophosphoesterase [Candidatus Eremiobacterota bacterium]